LDDREGLTAANTPHIAQYAPNTPKITPKIAVLLIKNPTKSAFTITALAAAPWEARAAANGLVFVIYPHLTPAAVNK